MVNSRNAYHIWFWTTWFTYLPIYLSLSAEKDRSKITQKMTKFELFYDYLFLYVNSGK